MPLTLCAECGKQISTTATACPQCGGVMQAHRSAPSVNPVAPGHRKVSLPLIFGIVLMPYIFAWFLLRKGYSEQSRIIGLGWMGLILVGASISGSFPNGGATAGTGLNIDPDRAIKFNAAATAKRLVPSALKDPSSATFGDVWGMSATVACGSVNAKNSFGAMTGKTRFIFEAGRASIDEGNSEFARRWNATCIDRPKAPSPTGAGTIRWGARPPSTLKQYAPPTDEGLAVYSPKGTPEPLEGIAVAEAGYIFDKGRLFSADFYIDGEAGKDAILAAYVKKYGTPQTYDEDAGSYSWKWPGNAISVSINYSADRNRTTVNLVRN